MIPPIQKFALLSFLALLVSATAVRSADDSKLIEWKSGSDPSGKIIDLELFGKPEIRGEAIANGKSGTMKFHGGSIVMNLTDAAMLRKLLTQNDQLTIEIDVIPTNSDQDGPARIFSYSTDHFTRNFTVGQSGDQFDLRLQTDGGLENGIIRDGRFGKIKAGKRYRLVIIYKPGYLAITVNGELMVERDDIKGSIKNWTNQRLMFGDELTGDRSWHGAIQGLAIYNKAKALRNQSEEKKPRSAGAPDKELKHTQRVVADLKKKIEALCAENADLKLRIMARDKAGSYLEDQLAECIKRHEDYGGLEKQLKEARSLAKREHDRAEKISDDILRQVDAQQAIVKELKETVALVQRERAGLLAKIDEQPKFDPEQRMRLIAENVKLSKSLKDAWEKGKTNDKAKADQEMKLDQLTAAKKKAEKQAITQRAEAIRDKIERKKLESQLAQLKAAAAKQAEKNAATARAKIAAEAKLLDIAPIYFGKNQADSEAQEKSLIAQLKEVHATWPTATFGITGHTCTDGTPAGNLVLSQHRAQRIADLLILNGIPKGLVVEIKGNGQTEPKSDNSTQHGREANRRVEVKVSLK